MVSARGVERGYDRSMRFERALERRRDLAPLILRLFLAFVLIYGTMDNVFSRARMIEFRDFLAANGFPWPMASAHLSAYAQFITGVLLVLGLWTRPAAAIVVVNFIVAIAMVHLGLPFNANIAPLAMLVCATFFVLYGAPRYSLDARGRAGSSFNAK